jgi:hypothetical protein
MQSAVPAAFACVPGAICSAERTEHFDLISQLMRNELRALKELENGYEMEFDVESLPLLARFMANERLCCPFIDFQLSIGRDPWPTRLRLTGDGGIKEVLRAELGLGKAT